MFGAYQAGVWEVLSEHFKPDLVVGASVGALNGYAIASGMRAGELVRKWQSLEDTAKLRWRMSTRCLLDPAMLDAWIQEMCRERQPKVDYAAVVTTLPSLRHHVFRWPEVRWEHLAASCGVPVFLPLRRIDGALCADGGIIDPLPLWAAVDLGATSIVSVNVLCRRPLPVRTLVGTLRKYSGYDARPPNGLPCLEINPSGRLGTVKDSMYWSRSNADRWIDLGRRDAQDALSDISDVECFETWRSTGSID
jgi:NTE family protein